MLIVLILMQLFVQKFSICLKIDGFLDFNKSFYCIHYHSLLTCKKPKQDFFVIYSIRADIDLNVYV